MTNSLPIPSGYPCAGTVVSYTHAYYTWTDTDPTASQDYFDLLFSTNGLDDDNDQAFLTVVDTGQPEKNLGDPCDAVGGCGVGEPITISGGNVFEQAVDYQTAGINPLAFIRYYNSRPSANYSAASLGKDWRNNYDRYLHFATTTQIYAERANGQVVIFSTPDGVGWFADSDVNLALSTDGTDWYLTDTITGEQDTYTKSGSLGSLATITSRDTYAQTMHYTSGKLTSVTDNQGRTLTMTYSGSLLQTVATPGPGGLTLTYAYDGASSDRLHTVAYNTSPASTITYNHANTTYPYAVTSITDELGNTYASWTYDAYGRGLTSQRGGGADLTTVSYNDTAITRTVTNTLGQANIYDFPVSNGGTIVLDQGMLKISEIDRQATSHTAAASMTYGYDTYGRVGTQTDWNGNVTNYTNNGPVPTKIVEASGSGVARTTTYTYNNPFFATLPTEIDTARNTTTFTYDSNGNMAGRTVIDETSQSVPYSTNGQKKVTTYTYDGTGHRLTATDPLGHVTSYGYDTKGNLTTITNALSQVTTLTNYNGRGQPQAIIDPNGVTTSLTYDVRGRLLTRIVSPTGGNAITTFAYDAAGDLTTLTLADGSQLRYAYDTAHRLVSVKDSAGDLITYTLDSMGNVTQQQIKDPSGTLVKTQSRVYDALGRLFEVIGASSQTTTYGYDSDGNRTSIKDALGNVTTQVFDALNRLSAVTDPLTFTTTTTYDSQDNRTAVTDPRGLITSYVYDGFGQVIQEVSPDRGTMVYYRDAAGNVTYSYDREISRTYPNYTSENMAFSYDSTAGGNKGIGRLTGYTDESGQTTLTYDERGNTTVKTRAIGTYVYTTSYVYDKADHLTQETYPSGRIVTYVYDTAGRVGTITTSKGGTTTTLASGITWEPFGPVAVIDYGNGVVGTHAFDLDYRMTTITAASSGLNVQNLSLAYDGVDDITSITNNLDSTRTQTFTYDKDYRLASAHNGTSGTFTYGDTTYTYDANGNRLIRNTGQVTTYTYEATTNRLTSTNKAGALRTFTYTATGGMNTDSRSPGIAYGYGGRDMEHAFSENGVLTSISQYTALGQRVVKWVSGGQTTHYHYDENSHLIAEGNGNILNSFQKEYIWLGDLQLATTDSGGNIYYVHSDQIGTPQKITGSGATPTIVWDRIAQPFGEPYPIIGTLTYNLGAFPGQYIDTEQSLYYNGVRTYDQSIGRYIVADPLGITWGSTTASRNLYGYANQNPVRFYDRSGLLPIDNGDDIQYQIRKELGEETPQEDLEHDQGIPITNNLDAGLAARAVAVSQQENQCQAFTNIASDLENLGGGLPRSVPTPKGATQFIFPNGTVLRFDLEPGQYLSGQSPHINLEYDDENIHIDLLK